MEERTNWARGLAALIYWEKPKKLVKTKDRPEITISFEDLKPEEQDRYLIIANNIFNYLGKLNLDVAKKSKTPGVDLHSAREQRYEDIVGIIKKWAKEVKLLKAVEGLVPWEEVAKRVANV